MNAMDARVIGASAVTAAAVAMVTVVVYEGHVKVERPGGQTVVVAPGTTYQVKPETPEPVVGTAPVEPANPVTIGAACDAEALKDKGMQNINLGQHAAALADFEASLRCKADPYVVQLAFMSSCASENSPKAKLYYKQLTPAQQTKFAQMCIRTKTAYEEEADDARCDEVSCVLTNYEGACCDKYKRTPDALDRAAISKEMNRLKPDIYACAKQSPAGGKVKVQVAVKPDGSVKSASSTEAPDRGLGSCVAGVVAKATFPATKNGGSFTYPFVFAAGTPAVVTTEPAASCDAIALKQEGMQAINLAQHAQALSKFEASYHCKADPYVLQLVFMEACASNNSPKAKQYYPMLSPVQQGKFRQMCIRNKVEFE